MKYLLLIILFAGLSIPAADGIYAIVKGTNVVAVWQFDSAKPPKALTNAPFAGSTNVAITDAEHSVIKPGWSYYGGVFRDKTGVGLPGSVVAKKAREEKAKAFVAKYNERKADLYTLKVDEQGDVLGRLCALIEAILELHPELLEPKETSQ